MEVWDIWKGKPLEYAVKRILDDLALIPNPQLFFDLIAADADALDFMRCFELLPNEDQFRLVEKYIVEQNETWKKLLIKRAPPKRYK